MTALCGARWPYRQAADGLGRRRGASLSAETVRAVVGMVGSAVAAEHAAVAAVAGAPPATAPEVGRPVPDRIEVAADGAWVPSHDHPHGMEGNVGVVQSVLPAFLADDEIQAVRSAVSDHDEWLESDRAILAHGDLDATHIYHWDGQYTGIIDFGEIRGADSYYDLGHVALHEGEATPFSILPQLLAGYNEVAPLPADHMARIQFWNLLIGVRALARSTNRPRSAYQPHLTHAIRQALVVLHVT